MYPYIPATLETLAVPLDELTLYAGNARRGDVPRIRESLIRHGQYRPIVVNRRPTKDVANIVLAGNHTFKGMCSLRDKPPRGKKPATHIAVTFVDVDAETAAKINLIDNKLGDDSSYDNQELAAQLRSLSNLEGTGYGPDDLTRLLEGLNATEVEWPTIQANTLHQFICHYTDDDEMALMTFLGADKLPAPHQLGQKIMEAIRER